MKHPEGTPVVVGVSGDQPELLSHAARLARELGAPLRVVHAYWLPPNVVERSLGRDASAVIHDEARAVLDRARRQLTNHDDQAISYVLRFAPAMKVLEAESAEALALVLGADDVNWVDRLLGGEVARHTAFRGRCPIVVVPRHVFEDDDGDVIVGIDVGDASWGSSDLVPQLAQHLGARVRIITVLAPGIHDLDRERASELLRHVEVGWHERCPDLEITRQVKEGDACSELAAEAGRARFLVLGSPRHVHPLPLPGQAVARRLLRTSIRPIVVMPRSNSPADTSH